MFRAVQPSLFHIIQNLQLPTISAFIFQSILVYRSCTPTHFAIELLQGCAILEGHKRPATYYGRNLDANHEEPEPQAATVPVQSDAC